MKFCLLLAVVMLSFGEALAEDGLAYGNDFVRLGYNNPAAIVDLKAGFCCESLFRVVDVDGDGQDDIVIGCEGGTWPWSATYLFRNPTPKGKVDVDPVFPKVSRVRVEELPPTNLPPLVDARGKPIARVHYTDCVKRPDFWIGRDTKRGDMCLADLDGDGIDDYIIRTGDRDMEAWHDCYDERGNWMRTQLRSFVYVCKGLGKGRFDQPKMIYLENELPLETYGGYATLVEDWDGDGDLDMILFDFMDSIYYFENRGSRTSPSFTVGRCLRTTDGDRLQGDLCMGRAVANDWDRDGKKDIVFSEEDSRVGWFRNSGRMQDGLPVFEQACYFRQAADEVNFGSLCCPWTYDWDGDGDQDLIVGNAHGQIAFIENLSGSGVEQPKWNVPRYLTEPDGRKIWVRAGASGSIQGPCESKWGYMTLSVADWDGDGLPDIMGNNIMGIVLWWKNIGSRQKPMLDYARRVEVEWEDEQPELKWGWRKPKLQENPKDLLAQWRTTPVMFDWDGDGLTDLLMLDSEGYFAFFKRARREDGTLVVKSPRRVFCDEKGVPLLLRCWFNRGVGCGRRKFAIGDWDGDGRNDIILNGGPNAQVLVQTGAKDGCWMFKPAESVAKLDLSTHDPQPAVCDFNADGIPDLIFGAMDGFVYYLRNPRSGRCR